MKIDFVKKQIITTKTEAIKASKIDSKEYKDLKELMNQYPSFNVVLRTSHAKRRKSRYDLKGLNYKFIKSYISNHGTEDQMLEFNIMCRGIIEDGECVKVASYGEIKKWFLECFPEIKAASASKNKKEAV